jgi:nicotinate-nucleotide pyrophosphorylase (carboxylating)
MPLPPEVRELIERALREDVGPGDATTSALLSPGQSGAARLIAKSPLVVAGLPFAEAVFHAVDPETKMEALKAEGERAAGGETLAGVSGSAASLLAAERVALNILQGLSGVATLTAEFVRRVEGTGVRILDTRKTTPGMRLMEKYAVRVGGGSNHRFGLFDGVLIKDNHIRAAGGIARAVALVREARAGRLLRIEVEAETLEQVEEALLAGADVVMLDNMSLEDMRKAVALARGRAALEASGNVTLETVAHIAHTGVDYISTGAITHSAPAADISMEMD